MVKTLTMKCPHCNQVSDVFLSTNACVIVLNCPSCLSPIMYFESKSFLLSKNQMDTIKNSTKSSAIMKMLEKIAHQEIAAPERTEIAVKNNDQNSSIPVEVIHRNVNSEKYIGEDDITNLKIELALCNDSQQFIDNL